MYKYQINKNMDKKHGTNSFSLFFPLKKPFGFLNELFWQMRGFVVSFYLTIQLLYTTSISINIIITII